MRYQILSIAIFCLLITSQLEADEFVYHHDHVLGTNMELRINTNDSETATRIEGQVLCEIDRLSGILSGYDKNSEFSRWQGSSNQAPFGASPELIQVLDRAEHWRKNTGGAFDVRVSSLSQYWKANLGQSGSTASDRHELLTRLESSPYSLDKGTVTRNDDCAMTLDGLAKGFVLDSICELVLKDQNVKGFVVNIGGDLRKFGATKVPVSILDPLNPYDNASVKTTIQLDEETSVATSGGYFRNVKHDGKSYSHIFDPRTGLPVESVASVTVMSPNAVDADALATSISVLGIKSGMALIEDLVSTECFIVSNGGQSFASTGWPGEIHDATVQESDDEEAEDGKEELVVNFTLNRPKGSRYRRPYVAVWLEDLEGFPVKTGLLFLQTENPGPRWHRDLTRWYRNNRTRKLVEKTDVIGTVSSATRGPGEYSARFDGTDNQGKELADGAYTLCLEVARENGTYQIIREKVKLIAGSPIMKKMLKENIEVSEVSYSYTKPERKSKEDDTSKSGAEN
ncbi:MAG: DUF2271 domain-containing protein [Planctomycetota bacterium]